MHKRITLPITEIKDENASTKTFFFKGKLSAEPGQFIMLARLGVGEKPFSVSEDNGRYFGITVKKVGEFTERLFTLKVGDLLSIRGPYGTHFTVQSKKVCIVGGGTGIAPLMFLLKKLTEIKADTTVINGARTKDELLFINDIKRLSKKCVSVTDDGSFQEKGVATDILEKLLRKEHFDIIYGAGPEPMLVKILRLSEQFDVPCELSLERHIKCGMGLCGSCVMDPIGIRICKEGPVLKKEILLKLTEFGKYKRNASGNKIPFNR